LIDGGLAYLIDLHELDNHLTITKPITLRAMIGPAATVQELLHGQDVMIFEPVDDLGGQT
jgi:hypothetical protein